MARASRRAGVKSNVRAAAAGEQPSHTRASRRPGGRASNPRGIPPASQRNLLEDCAGIDEMGTRARPMSRRLNLQTDDLTDETGLEVGRQRNVPKTIANAELPKLDFADLDRGLPKLPGESGQRQVSDRSWAAQAAQNNHSAALEGLDADATQVAPRRGGGGAREDQSASDAGRRALAEDLEMPATLPVGPPPADSGIMRMRMSASAVLGAVAYNDEMKGKTVAEARRSDSDRGASGKSGRRKPKGRKSRRATGSGSVSRPARQQGSSTMPKPSGRTAKSGTRRAAQEAPRGGSGPSGRQSRRATATPPEPSSRASRRSKATRQVQPTGNSTMIMGIAAGIGLLLVVIAIVAYAGSGDGGGGTRKQTSGDGQAENTPQYWEKLGDDMVKSGGDRIQASDYLSKAADMYEDQGEKSKAEMVRAHAFGLRKDASVDFYHQRK